LIHCDDDDNDEDEDEINTDSKKKLVLIRKRLDNQLENQITAITMTTNEVSEGLCHRIFMRWLYESISVK
jgi:hypothetical protein